MARAKAKLSSAVKVSQLRGLEVLRDGLAEAIESQGCPLCGGPAADLSALAGRLQSVLANIAEVKRQTAPVGKDSPLGQLEARRRARQSNA